jgi:hypothetical protein
LPLDAVEPEVGDKKPDTSIKPSILNASIFLKEVPLLSFGGKLPATEVSVPPSEFKGRPVPPEFSGRRFLPMKHVARGEVPIRFQHLLSAPNGEFTRNGRLGIRRLAAYS